MCSRNDQCAFWEHESALFGIKLYPVMSLVVSWWWSLRAALDMANKRIYNTLLCACISKFWCCKCSIVMIWNARRNYEKAHVSDHALMQVREKQLILWAGTFSRSSKTKKCVSLLAFLIPSESRQFHWKLLDMVTLICGFGNKFKVLGVDKYGVEMVLVLLKSIINSLHLSEFI